MHFTPGKYVVTNPLGAFSREGTSIYSKVWEIYPPTTILHLIKIKNIDSEERVRGQIESSLDWVSIQNTNTGQMLMKPIMSMSEVTNAAIMRLLV